jgi:hypothetical protein
MGVVLLVGTRKGAVLLRSTGDRQTWDVGPLMLRGWKVTAFTRDAGGRYYAAVTHDVYGSAILVHDELDLPGRDGSEGWRQLESAPRYQKGEVGNASHLRIVGAEDPMGQYADGGRYVDQIWKLRAVGDSVYAGVSEAGLFCSDDRGKSWQPIRGLNDHATRPDWGAGFGGLCLHSVLVDEENPERLWVGISSVGVLRSDDGGETWDRKDAGVKHTPEGWCVHSLAHDPKRAEVIYRQDHRGMYRSGDAGDSWQAIENSLPVSRLGDDEECVFGFAVEFDPASGSAFALPLESDSCRFPHDSQLCVYRTQDGGASWQPLAKGLPSGCYASVLRGAMSLDGEDPCGVYFGTTSGSVYASADRGDCWDRLASDLPKVLCVEAFGG